MNTPCLNEHNAIMQTQNRKSFEKKKLIRPACKGGEKYANYLSVCGISKLK